ncbi:unnamed protein product, partial [Pylaiella littoralis]
ASPVEKQSKTDLTPPRPQRILGSSAACSNPRKSRQLSSIPLLEPATHERHQGDSPRQWEYCTAVCFGFCFSAFRCFTLIRAIQRGGQTVCCEVEYVMNCAIFV